MILQLSDLSKAKDKEVMTGRLDSYKMGRLKNAIAKIEGFGAAANEARKCPDEYETILKNFSATFNELKKEIAAI
jgi:hypothetical protein